MVSKKPKKETFSDWSMYNPPIINGYTPQWCNRFKSNQLKDGNTMISECRREPIQIDLDTVYNPLNYPNRSQAFYEQ